MLHPREGQNKILTNIEASKNNERTLKLKYLLQTNEHASHHSMHLSNQGTSDEQINTNTDKNGGKFMQKQSTN